MRDLVSMAAAAIERCRVWPKTAAQGVKCVRAHCRGAGSSRHLVISPVVFGEPMVLHKPTEIPQSSAISRTVSLLLWRTIVLTLAIISSFLDVDGRPERRSLSTEVLLSLNRWNQSNTCVRHIAYSPNACCNNWYVSVAVFSYFKTKLDTNALFGTSTRRKNRYDINARVISSTYCSQLRKRSHLQLAEWVAKTCTNMSRLVANTSHPVNNH